MICPKFLRRGEHFICILNDVGGAFNLFYNGISVNFANMIIRDKHEVSIIRADLLSQLKAEHAFWSYAPDSVNADVISDDQLIALTMRHLDLPEIKQLFSIFPYRKIKNAWKRLLVPEGEYLYTLNRFFAWYYFKAKRPDAYLKLLETRHLNNLSSISE